MAIREARTNSGLVIPYVCFNLSQKSRIDPLQVSFEFSQFAAVIPKTVSQREYALALPELTPACKACAVVRLFSWISSHLAQLSCKPASRAQRWSIGNDRPGHFKGIEISYIRADSAVTIDADHRDIS
jgi:hypothetical protein